MIILVTGGSGSGKSAYAENRLVSCGEGRRVYIATMYPYDDEGRLRVQRHRLMRSGKGFETVECYTDLRSLYMPDEPYVLLEDLSNLLMNELYITGRAANATVKEVTDEIMEGICYLEKQAKALAIVTNEIFSDGITYDPETMRYIQCLAALNARIAERANLVTEVVYGIPLERKRA